MMRRTIFLIVAVVALMLAMVSPAAKAAEYWDLTQGPVTLSYTVDLGQAANIAVDWQWNNASYVGLLSGGAAGAKMFGGLIDWGLGQFPTYPDNDASLDIDDKFNLQRFPNPGNYDESVYDVICTDPSAPTLHANPVVPGNNRGVWFDRDGVDPWQALDPSNVNGVTYNTLGMYDVVLTFTRISETTVAVCPTVNGIPTTYYTTFWPPPPVVDFTPAGISFQATEAQMRSMQVVVDTSTTAGQITVSDLTVAGERGYWGFEGFFSPIDNSIVNAAKAGQTIPVKWHLTGFDGAPLSDPASFVGITSSPGGSACAGEATDAIEQYVADSGLQYLGDGYWQFNWKTPKTYAGLCRIMTLTLSDGSTHTAEFQFK